MVLGVTELVCRAGGVSYIGSSRALSRTITMGAFEEGWTFLPDYLVTVEGLSGLVLLAATAASIWAAISSLRRGPLRPIGWILLAAVAGWAWQAADSALREHIVLYGRVIHPWMLFMSLAVADAIGRVRSRTLRWAGCGVAVSVAVVSFVPSALAYYRLAYPPDILYSLGIDTTRLSPDRMVCELTTGTSYASPGPLDRVTRYPYSDETNYLLVNFCQGPPSLPRPRLNVDRSTGTELYDGPHWLTFPAYTFEGFPPAARDAMMRDGYRVRVFRVASPSPGS